MPPGLCTSGVTCPISSGYQYIHLSFLYYFWLIASGLLIHIIRKSDPFPTSSKSPTGLFSPKEVEVGWYQSSFLMLEVVREKGVLAGPTCCCFLMTLGFAVGHGSRTSNSCLRTAAGMPWLVQVSSQVSIMSHTLGTEITGFLGTLPGLPFFKRRVAGAREEAICGHILIPFCPFSQTCRFL